MCYWERLIFFQTVCTSKVWEGLFLMILFNYGTPGGTGHILNNLIHNHNDGQKQQHQKWKVRFTDECHTHFEIKNMQISHLLKFTWDSQHIATRHESSPRQRCTTGLLCYGVAVDPCRLKYNQKIMKTCQCNANPHRERCHCYSW